MRELILLSGPHVFVPIHIGRILTYTYIDWILAFALALDTAEGRLITRQTSTHLVRFVAPHIVSPSMNYHAKIGIAWVYHTVCIFY